MLSLSLTLSFFTYTLSFILFTLFTLYSPLYSSFNTPGYPALLGLLCVTRVTRFTHLPTTWGPGGFIITCLTHLIFILHPCLYWLVVGYTSHYLPYLSSSIYPFLYSGAVITFLTHHLAFPFILVFILPQIYSLISFPLPTYLLYSTPPYIFQITYLLHFLNSPLYILPYSHFPYLSRPYPILHILSHITSLTCVPFIHFFITSKHYLPLYSQPN